MHGTREYRTWHGMIKRCTNPNDPSYANYGGRGIRVHDRYRFGEAGMHAIEYLVADIGRRPDGHVIDRINNDGDYCPGNLRWATLKESNQNKRHPNRAWYSAKHRAEFTERMRLNWLNPEWCAAQAERRRRQGHKEMDPNKRAAQIEWRQRRKQKELL